MTGAPRRATVNRKTGETDVEIAVNLDGSGAHDIATGVGFLDHMLAQVSVHGLIDLTVRASGDLAVDDHHTVEDVGITLGQALSKALGERTGIERMGAAMAPMDEALALCAIDVSGRGFLACNLELTAVRLGDFTTELTPEFFRALATNAGWTVHIRQLAGRNTHHIIEAAFKAFGRALSQACARNPRVVNPPSTKGVL